MMSRHEGVSCDSCLKGNFRGKRYKCLICYDYDLCATCYEAGASTTRHTTEHPMQCILTRSDFDLYYGGEALSVEQPQSFTCPFCGKMGFTEATLQEHVSSEHPDTSFEVVCPVCAALPGGEPNLVTDDFAAHLTLEHRSPRDLDEPSGSRHVRRIPHPGRGVGGTRARRANMHFSTSGGLTALSPSNRDSMDPIAELLSQLSGVRRSATASQSSTSTQLQQLQMQLQLERQQAQVARQQLERLPRRQTQTSNTQGSSTIAANAQPTLILESGISSSSTNSQFLLARCNEPSLSENDLQAMEIERADRSLFVQELLLHTLADNLTLEPELDCFEPQTKRAGSQDTNNSPRTSPPNIKDVGSPPTSGGANGGGGGGGVSGDTSLTSNSAHGQTRVSVTMTKKLSGPPSKALARASPIAVRDLSVAGQQQGLNSGNRSSGTALNRMGTGTGTIREVAHPMTSRTPVRNTATGTSPSSARRKLQRPVDGRNQSNEPPPPH